MSLELMYKWLLLSFFTFNSYANDYLTQLQTQAETLHLAESRAWLKLLHYHPVSFKNNYQSYVEETSFFNASDGKDNPQAELTATLAAFFRQDIHNDNHPQCRFMARLNWLKSQLKINLELLPKVTCHDYQQWQTEVDAQKIVLVFASAYLNSPSSMFGHSLLRIESKNQHTASALFSQAINFGANIREADNSMLYALKGLTGGYSGNFVLMPFSLKMQEYGKIENRDLWEYELNLTASEMRLLIAHLWELQQIHFAYYFTTENCAFRILELIETVRPDLHLIDDFNLIAIPSDTIHAVEKAGLIAKTTYRPAQAFVLKQKINALPKDYQRFILELVEDITVAQQTDFRQLESHLQQQLVEAAYLYLRYSVTQQPRNAAIAKKSYALLKLLNTYPITPVTSEIAMPIPPQQGHNTHLFSLGFGATQQQLYAELGGRWVYHDLLDNMAGFLPGAQITAADTRIRISETGQLKLQKLELFNITSLNPQDNFFQGYSWKINAGLERQFSAKQTSLTGYMNGGLGGSYELWSQQISYAFLNARLENNPSFNRIIEPALGITLGQLFYTPLGTVKLEGNAYRFLNAQQRYNVIYEQNFVLQTNHALRFFFKQEWQNEHSFHEINLAYRYYF